jgi:hypothetical protein
VHSFLPSVHRLNPYRHGKIFFHFFVFLFVDCGDWKMRTPGRKLPTDLLVSSSGVDLKGVCYVCTNISYCWKNLCRKGRLLRICVPVMFAVAHRK